MDLEAEDPGVLSGPDLYVTAEHHTMVTKIEARTESVPVLSTVCKLALSLITALL